MTGPNGSLFHGGAPGLRPGDRLDPTAQRQAHEGCAACEANAAGHAHPLSPATPEGWVYATESRDYARFYASLYGRGSIYRVRLDADSLEPDPETGQEAFGAFRARHGEILHVVELNVVMTQTQRRRLIIKWGGTAWEADQMVRMARQLPQLLTTKTTEET